MADGRYRTLGRRAFLQSVGAAGVSSALTPLAWGTASHAIGIQLYTLQTELVRDFTGTLTAIHQIGYQQVEPVGTLGRDPKDFKAALDAAGLAVPSAHILSKAAQQAMLGMATGRLTANDGWAQINREMNLARIDAIMADMFEQQAVLGNEYLVLASLDSSLLTSRSGIDQVVKGFNRAGELCAQKKLKFAWHPHLAEFGMVDGKRVADSILEATDPAKVFVELDFFWASMAHVDIPQFLERYRGRFRLGHVKDIAKSVVVPAGGFTDLNAVPQSAYEDVGFGQMDYRTLIPLARKAGMQYFFVERDYAPDPLANARRSYGTLRGII